MEGQRRWAKVQQYGCLTLPLPQTLTNQPVTVVEAAEEAAELSATEIRFDKPYPNIAAAGYTPHAKEH